VASEALRIELLSPIVRLDPSRNDTVDDSSVVFVELAVHARQLDECVVSKLPLSLFAVEPLPQRFGVLGSDRHRSMMPILRATFTDTGPDQSAY
jgi:hypothetical protein